MQQSTCVISKTNTSNDGILIEKTLNAFTINLTHKATIRKNLFPTNLAKWNNSFQF